MELCYCYLTQWLAIIEVLVAIVTTSAGRSQKQYFVEVLQQASDRKKKTGK